MTKDQWRTWGKARRRALDAADRAAQAASLTRQLAADPRWQRAQTVLLFLHFGSEWDTSALIRAAWQGHKTVALTRCLPDHRMQPCRYLPETPLVTTLGSLREIAPEAAVPLAPEAIDLCLVPGLLFDPYGTRLGYGAGYYDRFLPQLRPDCTLLAAGYDCQLVGSALPAEATDVRLPEVLTPSTHLRTRAPF